MTRVPGDLLLHPISLGATALYAWNDWWLKAYHPGLLSGKLSDVAGMIVLPLTLYTLCEIAARKPLSSRWLCAMIAVSALGFAMVEVVPLAETVWCFTWGALQWPFRAIWALLFDGVLPPLRPVVAWSDPTDLLTVPFGVLAWFARRKESPRWRARRRRERLLSGA